jgi:hypothetical protein
LHPYSMMLRDTYRHGSPQIGPSTWRGDRVRCS